MQQNVLIVNILSSLIRYKTKQKPHKKRIVTKVKHPTEEKAPTYSTGTKVSHPKFGDGIIMGVEQSGSDMSLTIAFKNEYGVKKLLSSMAKLKTL